MGAQETLRVSLDDLQEIVGGENARVAEAGDAVDGVQPSFVADPASVEEVSRLLKLAGRAGLRVAPRGGGTKLRWGNPPSGVDLVIGTLRLNRVQEYSPEDLVARVEAGVRLSDLQEQTSGSSQMLALDPPEEGATIGGIVAANSNGPRRFRYGTVRDLLLGATAVLADGTVAKTGGKVVKNVAGYDLGKLYTGSLGTLGIIVDVTFRLHPLPESRRTAVLRARSPESARDAVQSILHSKLVPSAVELNWGDGGGEVAVLIESIEPGAIAQAETARELMSPSGEAQVLEGEEEAALWERFAAGAPEVGTRLKVNALINDLDRVLNTVRGTAEEAGLAARITGHAGSGVTYVTLSGEEEAQVRAIQRVRGVIRARGGSVVVLDAPAEVKSRVDAWGPVGDAQSLMRRVKARFDPDNVLNPGRFVGGI
jgi:glycolate oxidase FAD binding subunit